MIIGSALLMTIGKVVSVQYCVAIGSMAIAVQSILNSVFPDTTALHDPCGFTTALIKILFLWSMK